AWKTLEPNGQRLASNSTRRLPVSQNQETWSPGSSTTVSGKTPTKTERSAIAEVYRHRRKVQNRKVRLCRSGANQAAYQFFVRLLLLADVEAFCNALFRFAKLRVGVVVDGYQRLAGGDAVADARVKLQSHAGIDRVFLLLAASAEHRQRDAKFHAVGGG